MDALKDRVALITGAGGGLGRALAGALAPEGMAIGAIDLKPEPLATLATDLTGTKVAWTLADVTDRPALRAAVAELEERLGPVDLMIANAGIGLETPGATFPAEAIEAVIRVNLIGVVNTIAAVLPGMIKRQRGHLVAISSLAAFRGLPRLAGYCASKAGVNAVMEALRVELRPLGISVTTICPGWIQTPMTADLDVAKPHLMEAAEAARRIVHAIRRRRPFYAFPPPAARRLRLLRWLPSSASDWLLYRVVRSLGGK